jgi:hypothetical protein
MSQEYAHHDLGPQNGITICIGQKIEDMFTAMGYTLQKKNGESLVGLMVHLSSSVNFNIFLTTREIGCVGQHFQWALHCQGHASCKNGE